MLKYPLQTTAAFLLSFIINGLYSVFFLPEAKADFREGLDLLFSDTPYLQFTRPLDTKDLAQELLASVVDSTSDSPEFNFINTNHASAVLRHMLETTKDESSPFFIQACYLTAMLPAIPGKPCSSLCRASYLRRAHKKLVEKEKMERLPISKQLSDNLSSITESADECYTRSHLWKYPPIGISPNQHLANLYMNAAIELYTLAIKKQDNEENNVTAIKNQYRLGCCLLQQHKKDKEQIEKIFQRIKDDFPLASYQLANNFLEKDNEQSVSTAKILCQKTITLSCPQANILLYHLLNQDPYELEQQRGMMFLYRAALTCHPKALLMLGRLELQKQQQSGQINKDYKPIKRAIGFIKMANQYGSAEAACYLARLTIHSIPLNKSQSSYLATFLFLNPSYGTLPVHQNIMTQLINNENTNFYNLLHKLFNTTSESWNPDVIGLAMKWYQSGSPVESYKDKYLWCREKLKYINSNLHL
ncbi:hypothetical protein CI610_00555 [invertebrate metagenome]|uniref:Uncharacterized protein n=1 Tax=invertebrate metagenome TaxID=1711999 RepID=A0A2H9TB51_9ZZZZ